MVDDLPLLQPPVTRDGLALIRRRPRHRIDPSASNLQLMRVHNEPTVFRKLVV
jgi:hypothetical protein